MSPKYFMRECKKIAQANGWTEGYWVPESKPAIRAQIIALAKSNNLYAASIGHHFPDTGTYTYDDGIIDYVLGAINPLTQLAIDMQKSGIPFAMSF